jgi:hypothetical protein
MEQTECSETSAYKITAPRKYPEESIKQHRNRLRGKKEMFLIIKHVVGLDNLHLLRGSLTCKELISVASCSGMCARGKYVISRYTLM